MTWIFLALLAPFFWAGSNIFDKYALEKISSGVYDFIFFGSIGSFITMIVLWLFVGVEETGIVIIAPIAAGFILNYSYLFYSHALNKEDASRVVPLYITYPVFVLALSYVFLGERLGALELIVFFIILLGAFILGTEKITRRGVHYNKALLFMLPAVLLISLYVIITGYAVQQMSLTDIFIYDFLGVIGAAFSLFLVPRWRREIISGIKKATMKKYGLFFLNDVIDLAGHVVYLTALSVAASVSMVAVLGGIQPFYVLAIAALATLFFPKIVSENIEKSVVMRKIIGTSVVVFGIVLLYMSGVYTG
jgi:drug/metabolite transporter (DMT)-like permease